jgi:gamma-butyrobetaine dioxygenase
MASAPVIDLTHRRLHLEHPSVAQPLPLLWLRHVCACPECCHANGQRLVDPATFTDALVPLEASLEGDTLSVVWAPDGHRSAYDLTTLFTAPPPRREPPVLWDAAIAAHTPTAHHAALTNSPAVLLRWLEGVDRLGLGLLRGVPVADGEVTRVAELFGFVRETNYGRWFDVRAAVDPTNLADTSLGLPPHTDNPYRDPAPTLQLLHCLQSTASGGDNVLVDAWRVAAEVRTLDPDGFALLASVPVSFEYTDDTAEVRTTAPLVDLDASGTVRGVRFNNRSVRPPTPGAGGLGAATLAAWYDAFVRFSRLVDDERFQVRLHLEPGDLFIVDNRRVLHGRTAYDAQAGARHLQGCYADIDGLRSTTAVLRRSVDRSEVVVDRLMELFALKGDDAYIGEPVSQTEHAIKTAVVAQHRGAAPSLVAAALLHDIGHLVHGMADDAADHGIDTVHQEAGARYLAQWFPPSVTEPVRLHVAAKRYLCATDTGYLAQLSPASVHSLGLQGGPFEPAAAAAFADRPFALDAVELRRCDDAGKDPAMTMPDLASFRPLLTALVDAPVAGPPADT